MALSFPAGLMQVVLGILIRSPFSCPDATVGRGAQSTDTYLPYRLIEWHYGRGTDLGCTFPRVTRWFGFMLLTGAFDRPPPHLCHPLSGLPWYQTEICH